MAQIAKAEGRPPVYQLDVQDLIRDFNGVPHRMIRMTISGENFPVRNAPLFVRVRTDNVSEESWLVEFAASGDKIIAFFPVDLVKRGNVEFGYGNTVIAVFQNPEWVNFKMLDDALIDPDVRVVDKKWIERERARKK